MSPPATSQSGVHWIGPSGVSQSRAPAPARFPSTGERFIAWLVIGLLFACAAVALYDMYLLLSALGH